MPPTKEFDFNQGIPIETPDYLKPKTGPDWELTGWWFMLIIIGLSALFLIYRIYNLIVSKNSLVNMGQYTKYFVFSGVVAFILIQIVGNFSVYGGLIAGLWLGFWVGVMLKNEKKNFLKDK